MCSHVVISKKYFVGHLLFFFLPKVSICLSWWLHLSKLKIQMFDSLF